MKKVNTVIDNVMKMIAQAVLSNCGINGEVIELLDGSRAVVRIGNTVQIINIEEVLDENSCIQRTN